jgi:hypothetical protein
LVYTGWKFGPLFKRKPEIGYIWEIFLRRMCINERKKVRESITLDNELRNLYPPHDIITLIGVDYGETYECKEGPRREWGIVLKRMLKK